MAIAVSTRIRSASGASSSTAWMCQSSASWRTRRGSGPGVGQDLVDLRDRLVAIGREQLPQPRADGAHRLELGPVAPVPAGVALLLVEGGEGLDRGEGVRARRAVLASTTAASSAWAVSGVKTMLTPYTERGLASCAMTSLTHDTPRVARSRLGAGLGFALVSATTFGLSGALARGLLDSGWSARRRGHRPDRHRRRWCSSSRACWPCAAAGTCCVATRGLVAAYGVAAVAGAQLCYFYAVTYIQVGVALLIEYTAPVAVVVWLWLRHGHRPRRLTVSGAAIAAVGLVLVLDVVSGADLNRSASPGASARWSARRRTSSSPPTRTTACPASAWPPGASSWAARCCGVAGLLGVLPMRAVDARAVLRGRRRGLVGARPGPRPGHRRHRLRDRHRGRSPARVAGWRRSSRSPRC